VDAAIRLQDVSVNYRMYRHRSASLKAALIAKLKRRDHPEHFPALKALDLVVQPGESIAVLGPNGSGKSTLLKVIAGVFRPSGGSIEVAGKTAALLELGAGLAMDLNGIENIFLNGALLGMSRRETQSKLDAIVAFSELSHFIDSPIRQYSSGMFMRLAFSVAIHAGASHLLFDEVIAVGDAGFQAKCYDAIRKKREEGATLMIVSHAPDSLAGLCDRGIVLKHGQLDFDGPLDQAAEHYRGMFPKAD
jgi:ABC-type polysaccharide/polyol phosphate transport system ATPase subunit